jgi:hypothetical protein
MARLIVDFRAFRDEIQKYSRGLGLDYREAFRQAMSAAMHTAIRVTFPQGLGATDVEAGEATARTDIRRVFLSIETIVRDTTSQKLREGLEKSLAKGNWTATAALLRARGFKSLQILPFDPSLHEARRSRHGRVTGRPTLLIRESSDATLNRYIAKKISHVGRAKAGWLPAAVKFGSSRIPRWVARHAPGEGSAVDAMRTDERGMVSGYIEAINTNRAAEDIQRRWDVTGRALRAAKSYLTIKLQKDLEKRERMFAKAA